MNRPSIFAHSLHVIRVGTVRQLLGQDHLGDWHILATLPPMTDARVLLIDLPALARALQFRLINDLPPVSKLKARASSTKELRGLVQLVGLILAIVLAWLMQVFKGR